MFYSCPEIYIEYRVYIQQLYFLSCRKHCSMSVRPVGGVQAKQQLDNTQEQAIVELCSKVVEKRCSLNTI